MNNDQTCNIDQINQKTSYATNLINSKLIDIRVKSQIYIYTIFSHSFMVGLISIGIFSSGLPQCYQRLKPNNFFEIVCLTHLLSVKSRWTLSINKNTWNSIQQIYSSIQIVQCIQSFNASMHSNKFDKIKKIVQKDGNNFQLNKIPSSRIFQF